MDTLIFLGIFLTFLAIHGRRRWLSLGLFLASLIAMLVLFCHHATSHLPLNF